MNNKREKGYFLLFKKKYDILTIEWTKGLKLQTHTTDF